MLFNRKVKNQTIIDYNKYVFLKDMNKKEIPRS